MPAVPPSGAVNEIEMVEYVLPVPSMSKHDAGQLIKVF